MRHVLLIAGLLGVLAGRPALGQCEYELTWIVPPQGICAGSLIGILGSSTRCSLGPAVRL